jgi:hypothetical protein
MRPFRQLLCNAVAASLSPTVPSGSLNGLNVAVFLANTDSAVADEPVAMGTVTNKIAIDVYSVTLNQVAISPVIEIGSRVFVKKEATPAGASNAASVGNDAASSSGSFTVGGLVAKVNGNGTFAVLLDDDKFVPSVPRSSIFLSEGRSRLINNETYRNLLKWVCDAGVDKRSDQESTACVLFHRGWRQDKLYLLEGHDVHCLSHLNKSVRMTLLEKAEWEREVHRQKRDWSKERLKEKDFRYVLTKYSGVFSVFIAACGAASVFTWNWKNWSKQQRFFQVDCAVRTLKTSTTKEVKLVDRNVVRRDAEDVIGKVIRQLDSAHPRVVVLTGPSGAGKSIACRTAAVREHVPAVFVDVRGNEDPLRAIVKSMGVQNVDVCGDLLDFIAEVCGTVASPDKDGLPGRTPLLVFKLRDAPLDKVYNEAITLACDRRLCHVMIEVPTRSVTVASSNLPRLHFVKIPDFTVPEAILYTQHLLDPVELAYCVESIGTNPNDLDEILAAVTQGTVSSCVEYANAKVRKALRQLRMTVDAKTREALRHLSQADFDVGDGTVPHGQCLRADGLRDVVYYDTLSDKWKFSSKVFLTAASCLA